MTTEEYEKMSVEFTQINNQYNRVIRRGDAAQDEIDKAELALMRARKTLDAAHRALVTGKEN